MGRPRKDQGLDVPAEIAPRHKLAERIEALQAQLELATGAAENLGDTLAPIEAGVARLVELLGAGKRRKSKAKVGRKKRGPYKKKVQA